MHRLTNLIGEIYTSKAFGGGVGRPEALLSAKVILTIAIVLPVTIIVIRAIF